MMLLKKIFIVVILTCFFSSLLNSYTLSMQKYNLNSPNPMHKDFKNVNLDFDRSNLKLKSIFSSDKVNREDVVIDFLERSMKRLEDDEDIKKAILGYIRSLYENEKKAEEFKRIIEESIGIQYFSEDILDSLGMDLDVSFVDLVNLLKNYVTVLAISSPIRVGIHKNIKDKIKWLIDLEDLCFQYKGLVKSIDKGMIFEQRKGSISSELRKYKGDGFEEVVDLDEMRKLWERLYQFITKNKKYLGRVEGIVDQQFVINKIRNIIKEIDKYIVFEKQKIKVYLELLLEYERQRYIRDIPNLGIEKLLKNILILITEVYTQVLLRQIPELEGRTLEDVRVSKVKQLRNELLNFKFKNRVTEPQFLNRTRRKRSFINRKVKYKRLNRRRRRRSSSFIGMRNKHSETASQKRDVRKTRRWFKKNIKSLFPGGSTKVNIRKRRHSVTRDRAKRSHRRRKRRASVLSKRKEQRTKENVDERLRKKRFWNKQERIRKRSNSMIGKVRTQKSKRRLIVHGNTKQEQIRQNAFEMLSQEEIRDISSRMRAYTHSVSDLSLKFNDPVRRVADSLFSKSMKVIFEGTQTDIIPFSKDFLKVIGKTKPALLFLYIHIQSLLYDLTKKSYLSIESTEIAVELSALKQAFNADIKRIFSIYPKMKYIFLLDVLSNCLLLVENKYKNIDGRTYELLYNITVALTGLGEVGVIKGKEFYKLILEAERLLKINIILENKYEQAMKNGHTAYNLRLYEEYQQGVKREHIEYALGLYTHLRNNLVAIKVTDDIMKAFFRRIGSKEYNLSNHNRVMIQRLIGQFRNFFVYYLEGKYVENMKYDTLSYFSDKVRAQYLEELLRELYIDKISDEDKERILSILSLFILDKKVSISKEVFWKIVYAIDRFFVKLESKKIILVPNFILFSLRMQINILFVYVERFGQPNMEGIYSDENKEELIVFKKSILRKYIRGRVNEYSIVKDIRIDAPDIFRQAVLELELIEYDLSSRAYISSMLKELKDLKQESTRYSEIMYSLIFLMNDKHVNIDEDVFWRMVIYIHPFVWYKSQLIDRRQFLGMAMIVYKNRFFKMRDLKVSNLLKHVKIISHIVEKVMIGLWDNERYTSRYSEFLDYKDDNSIMIANMRIYFIDWFNNNVPIDMTLEYYNILKQLPSYEGIIRQLKKDINIDGHQDWLENNKQKYIFGVGVGISVLNLFVDKWNALRLYFITSSRINMVKEDVEVLLSILEDKKQYILVNIKDAIRAIRMQSIKPFNAYFPNTYRLSLQYNYLMQHKDNSIRPFKAFINMEEVFNALKHVLSKRGRELQNLLKKFERFFLGFIKQYYSDELVDISKAKHLLNSI